MQCPCCISNGDGFHSGHQSPHATLYSPPPPQHIVHHGFTYSLSPVPTIAPHVPQGHHLHTQQQMHLHHPMRQQQHLRHPLHQPHVHHPLQQHQAVRGAFTPTQRTTPIQSLSRRTLFTHSPCRQCTSPMAPSTTSYMRVVSPLHIASPQLHSPEVSSTVSTPASADKGHHRPFIVQGLHSVNVATCALSGSDTESECSREVAQINVFKDPNHCLPASRIPPPQISLEEAEDNTEYSTNTGGEAKGEQGEQKQDEQDQGSSDHTSDMLPDTVKEYASAQQEQSQKQVEEKQKVTPNKKKATSKPATRRTSRVCMPRKTSRAKRLKVEVEGEGNNDDAKAVVPEVQKPPLQIDSVSDVIVAVSPLAVRKRSRHNKTLSSDDEEDDKPSSVQKVPSPKKATSKETVGLPSSQQGPEKPVGKPSPAKAEQQLHNWYFHVCGSFVIVEGDRVDDGSNTIWHSGPIVEREGPYRIKTKSGSVYVLLGKINSQLTIERGAPASLVMKFKRGFPEDWEQLFQKYYRSYRGAQSVKKKTSSGKSKGVPPVSAEPHNDGDAPLPAVVSVKGGERSGRQQLKHSSPNLRDAKPTTSATKKRSSPPIKQNTSSMEWLGEEGANSSLRRSRRGRLLKSRGMKVDYDFYGNIRSFEELDTSVGSDTSMYLQKNKAKKKVVPSSSTQQGSRSGRGYHRKVGEECESAFQANEVMPQKSRRGRPRLRHNELSEDEDSDIENLIPVKPGRRNSTQLKGKVMPLKRKRGRPQLWLNELTDEEDSDDYIESNPIPARAERRTPTQSSLCETPQESCRSLPSQGQVPVSGRRVRFSDVHELGPNGSTTYSLGDTTASSSAEDYDVEKDEEEEEEEEEGEEEGSVDAGCAVEKDVEEERKENEKDEEVVQQGCAVVKDVEEEGKENEKDEEVVQQGCAVVKDVEEEGKEDERDVEGEEQKKNEEDRGNGVERQEEKIGAEERDDAVDEMCKGVDVVENSSETGEVADIERQVLHSNSDLQDTSVDYANEIGNAIQQVLADHLTNRQHSSDEFSQNENPQDDIFIENDPRRRSHRVRKFPNRGNVINWDFLSGVRGVPLDDQPADVQPRKRGRPSKSSTVPSLSPQRCKRLPNVILDTESEDVSTEEVPSPREKGNTSTTADKPKRRGRPPLHSQRRDGASEKKKREKPPLHARDDASSTAVSRQSKVVAACLTLPVQELSQSDVSTEEEEVGLRPWSQEDQDHLLRAVSKVPASSPNFWHAVAQDLQLVHSAEECQRVYQALVPSLTTMAAAAEKKPKKNDGTPVVTGKKGTLKRKTQIQKLIQRSEMGYSDDLLELTPFREKTLRVPAAVSDSEDGWEDEEVSKALLHTPANSLKKLMMAPSQNTPALCIELDSPDFRAQTSRMEADRKVFQLQKAQKRHRPPGVSKLQTKAKKAVAAVNPKQSTKWSRQLASLAASQSRVAAQLSAEGDQDSENGGSDHYCSNVEEEEGSDVDMF